MQYAYKAPWRDHWESNILVRIITWWAGAIVERTYFYQTKTARFFWMDWQIAKLGAPSWTQGRFKSILVNENAYLLPLSRYINLNPIRISRFKYADFPTKSEYLKKYPWSPIAGYCYFRKRNKNIDCGWLLSTYFCYFSTNCLTQNLKANRQMVEFQVPQKVW